MISYQSTRGRAGTRSFEEVLLAGLAEDGGLFVPTSWPRLEPDDLRALHGRDYATTAARVLAPFTAGCFDEAELRAMGERAYAGFGHAATAPLKQLGPEDWLLELFHGPTLAFKDFAMQLLGEMFDAVLARRDRYLTIIGATSGDTGAAAVRAFAGKSRIRIAMLHPDDRISPVQRRQMTTELSDNVLNIAVQGTFDDCQDLVKAMFADVPFRQIMQLSAVNSINWARVVAQAAYYIYAALRLGAPERAIAFCVPSGNFGNVYAGWIAHQIGLPVAKLVVAANSNDILARFLATGVYERATVVPTISPSMDIQVASNFERLLFAVEGEDGARIEALMQSFRQSGRLEPGADGLAAIRSMFVGGRADEATTARAMRATLEQTGELVDPHTAVALAVASMARPEPEIPLVTLATAHPAKFAVAVEAATGRQPALPPAFADIHGRKERCTVLPAELGAIQAAVRQTFGSVG